MFGLFNKKRVVVEVRERQGKILSFEDINLETFIRNTTGIKSGELYESDVKGIKELDFKGWPLISIRGIESVVNLETLILYQSKMNNISFLKKLKNLKKLDISWSDSISELESLRELSNLEELYISYSSNIKNFKVFEDLKKLRILDLSENYIYELGFLRDIDWLEELNLSKNNLSDFKLDKSFEKLKVLDLSANHFTEIGFIVKMANLEHLDISVNKIKDITILRELKNLKHLDARGNKIDFSNKSNKETVAILKERKCKVRV